MGKNILLKSQKKFLELFKNRPELYSQFVLSGGTALAGFYLFHRYSEDLDFFSEQEFNPVDIFPLLKLFIKPLGFQKLEYEQSFNRNLYFFIKGKEILKTEFTYFPFEPLQKPQINQNLKIDNLKDIAVNKVFTIYQKPRMRDFIDLYAIFQKEKWGLEDLLKLARIKFDTHIDPLQWGKQLLKVETLKDFPRMIKKMDFSKMNKFFLGEAHKTGKQIFK